MTYGTPVTFTATVSAQSGSTAPTAGSVDFYDTTTGPDLGLGTFGSSTGTTSTWTLTTGVKTFNVTAGDTITATYTAGTGFNGSSGTTTQTVTAIPITASGITAANKTYNGNTTATLQGLATASLSGVVSGDAVTLGTSGAAGTFASKDVGQNITVSVTGLTLGGTQAGDYTLTQPTTTANITAATLTVTGITATNKTYNGNTTAALQGLATASLVGVVSGDTVTLGTSGATGTFASQDVGQNITVSVTGLTIGGSQASDYTLTQPTTTANITPATLTVTGITATNKTYNGTTTAALQGLATASLVGVVSGDTVTLGTSGAAGTFASKDVGKNITVSMTGLTIGGSQAGDYTLTQPTTTANITAATLTVTGITAANKTYNGNTTAALQGLAAASLVGVVSGDTVTLGTSGATGTFASKDVGQNITVSVTGLTFGGSQAGDYTLTQPTTTANITAATLTVTGITAANKTYNGTPRRRSQGLATASLVGVAGGRHGDAGDQRGHGHVCLEGRGHGHHGVGGRSDDQRHGGDGGRLHADAAHHDGQHHGGDADGDGDHGGQQDVRRHHHGDAAGSDDGEPGGRGQRRHGDAGDQRGRGHVCLEGRGPERHGLGVGSDAQRVAGGRLHADAADDHGEHHGDAPDRHGHRREQGLRRHHDRHGSPFRQPRCRRQPDRQLHVGPASATRARARTCR